MNLSNPMWRTLILILICEISWAGYPQSVHEVLAEGNDIPAAKLNLWYFGPTKTSSSLAMLTDLNEESARIWRAMYDCAGQEYEEVRKRYYLNDWKCENAEGVKSKVKDLKNNIENFFVSFPQPENWGLNLSFEQAGYSQFHLDESMTFKPHPLFVQIVWEMISYYYFQEGLSLSEKMDNFLNELFHGEGARFRIKTPGRAFLKKLLIFQEAIVLSVNCESMGFWPKLNRIVVDYAYEHSNPIHRENFANLLHYPFAIYERCEKIPYFEYTGEHGIYSFEFTDAEGHKHPKAWSSSGKEAIKEFAKMYAR